MADHLYLHALTQQFYRVPEGVELPPGNWPVIRIPGAPVEVDRTAIAVYAIDRGEARTLLRDAFEDGAGEARKQVERLLEDPRLGGLADRFGDLLARPELERGLESAANALHSLAASLRKRRAEPKHEGGPSVLCPLCLAEVAEDATDCHACGADLDEPFVMSPGELASEPRRPCHSCGQEILRLAARCRYCGAEVNP